MKYVTVGDFVDCGSYGFRFVSEIFDDDTVWVCYTPEEAIEGRGNTLDKFYIKEVVLSVDENSLSDWEDTFENPSWEIENWLSNYSSYIDMSPEEFANYNWKKYLKFFKEY